MKYISIILAVILLVSCNTFQRQEDHAQKDAPKIIADNDVVFVIKEMQGILENYGSSGLSIEDDKRVFKYSNKWRSKKTMGDVSIDTFTVGKKLRYRAKLTVTSIKKNTKFTKTFELSTFDKEELANQLETLTEFVN